MITWNANIDLFKNGNASLDRLDWWNWIGSRTSLKKIEIWLKYFNINTLPILSSTQSISVIINITLTSCTAHFFIIYQFSTLKCGPVLFINSEFSAIFFFWKISRTLENQNVASIVTEECLNNLFFLFQMFSSITYACV